jgi:hypothetical protein
MNTVGQPCTHKGYFDMMMSLGFNGCFVTSSPFTNEGHSYGFVSNVNHSRLDSIRLLIYDSMRTIFGAPVLYYKSLGTTPTLSGRG